MDMPHLRDGAYAYDALQSETCAAPSTNKYRIIKRCHGLHESEYSCHASQPTHGLLSFSEGRYHHALASACRALPPLKRTATSQRPTPTSLHPARCSGPNA